MVVVFMSMENKMTKYMLDEIKMAEKYIELAGMCKDQAIALKLQEMAKEEMKHFDYLHEQIKKMQDVKIAEGKTEAEVYSESYDVFHKMYHHWEEKVKYMINSFTFKK